MGNTLATAAGSLWNALRPVLIAASCAFVTACGQGTYYAEKPDHVRAELREASFPTFFFGDQAVDSSATVNGEGTVIWNITGQNDDQLIRLSAKVAPDGKGARVTVDVLPPAGRNRARVEKGLAENGSIARLYRTIAAEHVDSTLNHRDFNIGTVTPAMMAATFATMPKISKQMSDAGDEFRRQDAERARHAPAGEANPGGSGGKFGDPMDTAEPGSDSGS